MEVYKFGGTSIKNAQGIINLEKIIATYNKKKPLVIIVSAIDKTTNTLEEIINQIQEKKTTKRIIQKIQQFHTNIASELFESNHEIFNTISFLIKKLQSDCLKNYGSEKEFYNQIVAYGELFSSKIIHSYLNKQKTNLQYLDVRELIKTNYVFKNTTVNWKVTKKKICKVIYPKKNNVYITQGFISSCEKSNQTTTLGREGSDFTAAIFGHCLNAQSVTVWKDVEGILNADPKKIKATKKFNLLSYSEAIKLSYYGAKVIHPKTIKPLENKQIPLYVKSFLNPKKKGTVIFGKNNQPKNISSIIIKEQQILISLRVINFSFINQYVISKLLTDFSVLNLKINLIQNSATTISIIIDSNYFSPEILNNFSKDYSIKHHSNLTLYTIRPYSQAVINKVLPNTAEIILIQKNIHTAQFLIKK